MNKRYFHIISLIVVVIFISSVAIFAQRGGMGSGRMMGPGGGNMGMTGNPFVSQRTSGELAMNTIDPMWSQVPGITVRVMPMMASEMHGMMNTVELKSLHNGSNVYMYARWYDPNPSVFKKMWVKTVEGWQKSREDEDRLAFVWDINQSMSSNMMGRGMGPGMMGGCALLCHVNPEDPSKLMMSTANVGGRVDVWHWKSARTNPAGFADDQYMDTEKRKNDSGSAVYKDNKSEDGKAPAYMFPGGTGTVPFLVKFEAVPFNDSLFAVNDKLPAYLLGVPTEDRASVEAYGVWADSYWTVVLKRSLNTGSSADVQFVPGAAYPFAIAIFDNAGDEYHLKSMMLDLVLQ